MDFIDITIVDVIDILIVSIILFYIYKLTKGTYAPSILTGIFVIYLLWIAVRAMKMELLTMILGHVVGVGTIALIVVFQPEIRRFLHIIGVRSRNQSTFLGHIFDMKEHHNEGMEHTYSIVKAVNDMATHKTGALIVLQRKNNLATISETGIVIDAKVSSSLLKNLFFKNSPMHDGAVIISEGRISAAKCILPLTETELPISLGMRHRAAVGMSEVSDALVIIVSEETGVISVAEEGSIKCISSMAELQAELMKII